MGALSLGISGRRPAAPPEEEEGGGGVVLSIEDTAVFAEGVEISYVTNVADGTIYVVITESNVAPTAMQIQTGQDENGAPAAGAEQWGAEFPGPENANDLTPETEYWAYAVQVALDESVSNVASTGPFTTTEDV